MSTDPRGWRRRVCGATTQWLLRASAGVLLAVALATQAPVAANRAEACDKCHSRQGCPHCSPRHASCHNGCDRCAPKREAPRPAPATPCPAPAGPACAEPVGAVGFGPRTPSGDGMMRLEKRGPTEVSVGDPFTYEIHVTNSSRNIAAEDVVVTDVLPGEFRLTSTDPKAEEGAEGRLRFALGRIDPGDSRRVRVTGTFTSAGCMEDCAAVEFKQVVCFQTRVVEPQLQLVKTLSRDVLICDPICMTLVVSNPGSGPARNVRVVDTLPEGWTTTDGRTRLVYEIGTLPPGEARRMTASFTSARPGAFTNRASATADGLKTEAYAETTVHEPRLRITKSGRERQYIGQCVTYDIEVTNTGDWASRNTTVTDVFEGDGVLIAPSAGGQLRGRTAVWALGDIGPGASHKMSITARVDRPSKSCNTATAEGYCAEAVCATVETLWEGIPAILLEVIDTDDPIEVGCPETYVITATNQGTAPDLNVQIVCILEDSSEFVSAGGATAGSHRDGVITFAPVRSLGTGQVATWRVIVKALAPHDTRFTVKLTSEMLDRSVDETESTHFYR